MKCSYMKCYFTAMQMNKLELYLTTWMNPINVILNERSKAQKNVYSMIHLKFKIRLNEMTFWGGHIYVGGKTIKKSKEVITTKVTVMDSCGLELAT